MNIHVDADCCSIGMKKPQELFFFFKIANSAAFKKALKAKIIPLVTSTATILGPVAQQPKALLNVAFSASGLKALNVTNNLGDSAFTAGQFANAANLKDDKPATNWVKGFQGTNIHGVFLIASDNAAFITESLKNVTTAFGSAITEVHRLQGAARPGNQAGHEREFLPALFSMRHTPCLTMPTDFGFLDGIAQPAVAGLGTPLPGQTVTDPGVFLLGETGDSNTARPAWAKDGSFLVFRQLKQFVPEFNKFLLSNPTNGSSELTGARMVGRWKSVSTAIIHVLNVNRITDVLYRALRLIYRRRSTILLLVWTRSATRTSTSPTLRSRASTLTAIRLAAPSALISARRILVLI
jgi:Dyp-type peroxidase family